MNHFDQLNKTDYDRVCEEAIAPYVNETADSCSYCDRIEPLILVEGQYTYVTLALGQIVPGYVQVVPKEHRTSIAGLLDKEIQEFEKMKKAVRTVFSQLFDTKGVAFEHGKVGACMTTNRKEYDRQRTSLCHHMHTHIVPVEIDVRTQIERLLPDSIRISSAAELKELRQGELRDEPYLYFEGTNEVGYVYPVEDTSIIPRQFLRSTIANSLGVPERADWFNNPGLEYFYEQRGKIKDALEKII